MPELLKGLKDASDRGAEVKVVYHCRQKQSHGHPDPADKTAGENQKAAAEAGVDKLCVQRKCDPQGAIMHDIRGPKLDGADLRPRRPEHPR